MGEREEARPLYIDMRGVEGEYEVGSVRREKEEAKGRRNSSS